MEELHGPLGLVFTYLDEEPASRLHPTGGFRRETGEDLIAVGTGIKGLMGLVFKVSTSVFHWFSFNGFTSLSAMLYNMFNGRL